MAVPENHFQTLESAIPNGLLTIFYGAGINYAQCSEDRDFGATSPYLPTGAELSTYLAEIYQETDFMECLTAFTSLTQSVGDAQRANLLKIKAKTVPDLAKSSQYAQTMQPPTQPDLQTELHELFSKQTPATTMHRWLAELPLKITCNRQPIYITTNYDVLLERALAEKGVPFDVLFYREPGPGSQVWLYHWKNAHRYYKDPEKISVDGWDQPVVPFEEYDELAIGDGAKVTPSQAGDRAARAVIVKIHGTVSPEESSTSSFVITQNDYISFLRRVPADKFLPNSIFSRILRSHFLFLGYGLGDTNILALCQNLWSQRNVGTLKNWAIQHSASDFDRRRWPSNGGVEVYERSLTDYVGDLEGRNL